MKKKKGLIAIPGVILATALLYATFIYSDIGFIPTLRTLYIETAMTTGEHQWLATSFIPGDIISAIMSKKANTSDITGGNTYLKDNTASETAETDNGDDTAVSSGSHSEVPAETTEQATEATTETSAETYPETEKAAQTSATPAETEAAPHDPDDILGLSSLKVGVKDYAGYKVSAVDIEQGLYIADVSGEGYKGKVMLIDDPSRVYVADTPYKNTSGVRIKSYLETENAIAGINASGFCDDKGEGSGGDVIGLSCSNGEIWGSYLKNYSCAVFTTDDKLVVGYVDDWENKNIRDGMQFGPVLVADGKAVVTGSSGYGLQPRTAIGQREDGAVIMLVIDGRSLSHSLGCTVGDLADIMLKYGAVNASCCDGGSSSVLAYDGEVINENSSLNPDYGRRLPNAFLVKRK